MLNHVFPIEATHRPSPQRRLVLQLRRSSDEWGRKYKTLQAVLSAVARKHAEEWTTEPTASSAPCARSDAEGSVNAQKIKARTTPFDGRAQDLGRIMITAGVRELAAAWPLGVIGVLATVRAFS